MRATVVSVSSGFEPDWRVEDDAAISLNFDVVRDSRVVVVVGVGFEVLLRGFERGHGPVGVGGGGVVLAYRRRGLEVEVIADGLLEFSESFV